MSAARWWVIPLLLALVVDGALVTRHEASPAMSVGRAILRTVRGGRCQEAMVMRGTDLDRMFILDTWLKDDQIITIPGIADFAPGLGLTPQSQQTITEGMDVDLTHLSAPASAHPGPRGSRPLIDRYAQQVRAGDSWLQDACVPFANPFQSHLQRVTTPVSSGGTRYTVYHGTVRYARGGFQLFPDAEVWIGVGTDGRLGFELLQQQPSSNGNAAILSVATLFTYPTAHLGSAFAKQAPSARESFYDGLYARVLATTVHFEQVTPLQIKH